MSCGDPHETDCSEVLDKVYVYLDGDPDGISDEDCTKIRAHLDECSPCLRQYGIERQVKALIARTCGCDSAPSELRERVLARIRQVRQQAVAHEYFVE